MVGGGYFGSSSILFGIARAAYERTGVASSERIGGQNDALVAIIFSAATLEAVVMEMALFAEAATNLSSTPSFIHDVANAIHEDENSHYSARRKYITAKTILPGESYDKGAQPFQDLDLLFSLRDHIIHLKPEKITQEPHKLVRRLRAMRLCVDEEPHVRSSWLSQVCTRGVARWACNVVARMAASICESLSQGEENVAAGTEFVTLAMSRFSRIPEPTSEDA